MAQRTLQSQGVPIQSELKGPRRPDVPQRSQRTSRPRTARRPATNRRVVESEAAGTAVTAREIRKYSPAQAGDKAGSGIGLLEAEYFAIIFLLIVQLFVGSAGYGDKIMAFMKRGMLTSILFFFLALIAAAGNNAAKVSKGIGALVFFAILVSTPGEDVVNALDTFFKSAWVGTGESAKDSVSGTSSSDTGTAGSSSGVIGDITSAVSSGASTTTELQIPGIGPAFVLGPKILDGIKKLLGL
jgi:hypothetical protein